MKSIMIATLLVGLIGLFIGIVLGIASEKFKVVVDEKEQKIRSVLPGNNCGACGYPGCDGLAHAIVQGEAPSNQCPVGGNEVGAKIASILGQVAQASTRYTAFVKCKGTCDKVTPVSDYSGIKDCLSAALVPGKGGKMCVSGCIGLGSCVQACDFDAIHIVDGVAVVDKEKCKGCQKCMEACPNHLIEWYLMMQYIVFNVILMIRDQLSLKAVNQVVLAVAYVLKCVQMEQLPSMIS